jgi:MscS family membrane protein
LNTLSNDPAGAVPFPDKPDVDLAGTIESVNGPVDVLLQRVKRDQVQVWLFSKETVKTIPALYEEVNQVSVEDVLPAVFTQRRFLGIQLFQWLAVFVGMPLVYILTGVLDALVSPWAGRLVGQVRKKPAQKKFRLLSKPIRLLLLVGVIRWMIANLNLPLLTRQFWSSISTILTVTALVWIILDIIEWCEDLARDRLAERGEHGKVSILRLVRRSFDLVVLFAGVVGLLYYFDLNVTAALAGLGVGGIAVALAAQKTLENVIGGISIIADSAVSVGSNLKVGATSGTVEEIGLRSTRIRTMERSVVSIPNGQISSQSLEDFSCRDKFWFHPLLRLRYETTAEQLRKVLESIRALLVKHARVEVESVRVRFLLFGATSLDVDVSAYVFCSDYPAFLEVQEELLLRIMDQVEEAGTGMAVPVSAIRVENSSPDARKDANGIPSSLAPAQP